MREIDKMLSDMLKTIREGNAEESNVRFSMSQIDMYHKVAKTAYMDFIVNRLSKTHNHNYVFDVGDKDFTHKDIDTEALKTKPIARYRAKDSVMSRVDRKRANKS
jgi:hypothetical protein